MGTANDIEKALTEWAREHYGAGSAIAGLRRLSGGASQETWAFEVDAADKGEALILRRAPGGVATPRASEAVTLATEAALLAATDKAGVRVPGVRHVSAPGSELGEAFIMKRIDPPV